MNDQSNQKIIQYMQMPFTQKLSADDLRRRRDRETDDSLDNNIPKPYNKQTDQSLTTNNKQSPCSQETDQGVVVNNMPSMYGQQIHQSPTINPNTYGQQTHQSVVNNMHSMYGQQIHQSPSNNPSTYNQQNHQSAVNDMHSTYGQQTHQSAVNDMLSWRPYSQQTITRTTQEIRGMLSETFTSKQYTPMNLIENEEDFNLKMHAYSTICNAQGASPNVIIDYPTDKETQQDLVRDLVSAMIYFGDECEDATSKKSVDRIKKVAPIELHLMAWRVLLETRDCQKGLIENPPWGKQWQPEQCDSFYARYTLVRSALHSSKAAVASLFDHSFSKRLTMAPTAEITKIRANRKVNRKRQGDLQLAAEEKKKRVIKAVGRGAKEHQDLQYEQPSLGYANGTTGYNHMQPRQEQQMRDLGYKGESAMNGQLGPNYHEGEQSLTATAAPDGNELGGDLLNGVGRQFGNMGSPLAHNEPVDMFNPAELDFGPPNDLELSFLVAPNGFNSPHNLDPNDLSFLGIFNPLDIGNPPGSFNPADNFNPRDNSRG